MLPRQKFKVIQDILTHQGTLHGDDIVTLVEDMSISKHRRGDAEYKVRDNVGKIWYIHKIDVKPL
jgi:hypothetical protein